MGVRKPLRKIKIVGDVAFVPLTQGMVAIIDAVDVPLVSHCNWSVEENYRVFYAVNSTIKIKMHNVIMGCKQIDHRDCDGLNNRRYNLRKATAQQNARNTRVRSKNISGYKGVSFRKESKRWRSYIRVDGKLIHLGTFDSKKKAALAYDHAAREHFGDFARLNFPFDSSTQKQETIPMSEVTLFGEQSVQIKSRHLTGKEINDKFLIFWGIFPRRAGGNPKSEAERKFRKAVDSGISHETIIAGARRFAAECSRNRIEARFVPMAVTWLNQRRWLDDPDAGPVDEPKSLLDMARDLRNRATEQE